MIMNLYLAAALVMLFSYLMGSINSALLFSQVLFHKDVRKYGSGNAGLTNFQRVFGHSKAYLVLLGDVLKTVVTVLLVQYFIRVTGNASYVLEASYISGAFVIIGHVFPVFYKFMGGKGVLVGGALTVILDWRVGVIAIGLFLLQVLLTRFVSLGSMTAAFSFPFVTAIFFPGKWVCLGAAAFCAILILYKHWGNLRRLWRRTEPKLSFHKKPEA